MNKTEVLQIFSEMRRYANGQRLKRLDEAIAYTDLYLHTLKDCVKTSD